MQNGELDVKNLIVVGFDFLQQYFISVNESQQKIMKVVPKQTINKNRYATTITYGYNSMGNYGRINNLKPAEEEASNNQFKLSVTPAEL